MGTLHTKLQMPHFLGSDSMHPSILHATMRDICTGSACRCVLDISEPSGAHHCEHNEGDEWSDEEV